MLKQRESGRAMKRIDIAHGSDPSSVATLYLPSDRQHRALPCLFLVPGFPLDYGAIIADGRYDSPAKYLCGEGLAVMVVGPTPRLADGDDLSLLSWAKHVRDALSYLEASPYVHPRRIAAAAFSIGAVICTFVAAHDSRISALAVIGCPMYLDHAGNASEELDEMVRRVRMVGIRQARFFRRADQEAVEDFRQMNPLRWVSRLGERPLLVMAGGQDLVVKPGDAETLFEAAGPPRRFQLLEGVGHAFVEDTAVRDALLGWVREIGLVGAGMTD